MFISYLSFQERERGFWRHTQHQIETHGSIFNTVHSVSPLITLSFIDAEELTVRRCFTVGHFATFSFLQSRKEGAFFACSTRLPYLPSPPGRMQKFDAAKNKCVKMLFYSVSNFCLVFTLF